MNENTFYAYLSREPRGISVREINNNELLHKEIGLVKRVDIMVWVCKKVMH